MIAAVLKETTAGENRVSATPQTVKELIKSGLTVRVQTGAGDASHYPDQDYQNAGAEICTDAAATSANANIILKVASPTMEEMDLIPNGSAFVSLFQTTRELEQVKALTNKNITGFSMHLIPRTTLAQSMDALSSQANIAGYKSVLIGAAHLPVYMPLLMTAAGTIPPAKVLILGAGVAGLQAIATAKRLGAVVSATDVRSTTKEQVESLGGKFLNVESSENLEKIEGFDKDLSKEIITRAINYVKKKDDEDIKIINLLENFIQKNENYMLDVNQGWPNEIAIKNLEKYKDYKSFWIEEPISADNDYETIKKLIGMFSNLAFGENINSKEFFFKISKLEGSGSNAKTCPAFPTILAIFSVCNPMFAPTSTTTFPISIFSSIILASNSSYVP